jgi:hypothetical protein
MDKVKMFYQKNNNHPVTGFVMCADDTDRVVASFYSETDSLSAMIKINAYDSNQELIKKQQEQIELLNGALKDIQELPSSRMDEGSMIAFTALKAAYYIQELT